MLRGVTAHLVVGTLLVLAPSSRGAEPGFPSNLDLGRTRLELRGTGVRDVLFVELYRAGLYLPGELADDTRIPTAGVAKAFRLRLTYDGSKPDEIPQDWREQLLPVLDPAQEEVLRGVYDEAAPGDVFMFQYVPGIGTQITRNGRTVLSDPQHSLMLAFVEMWIGDEPTSGELKRALLGR